jgi:hypothetical protein
VRLYATLLKREEIMDSINEIKEGVRKLPNYGRHITGLTPKGRKAIRRDLLFVLIRRFGLLSALLLLVRGALRGRREAKSRPQVLKKAQSYSREAGKDFPLLAGLFLVLSERMGNPDRAYEEIFKELIIRNSHVSMPELYEVDRLEKFSDPFEAFKEYNYGLFKGETNFPIDSFNDDGDHFHFKVTRCIQTELAKEFGAPQLSKLGCDHDCAGYPLIEDRVNCIFRRPETIAKGGRYCDFNFYRKGTEPKGDLQNL